MSSHPPVSGTLPVKTAFLMAVGDFVRPEALDQFGDTTVDELRAQCRPVEVQYLVRQGICTQVAVAAADAVRALPIKPSLPIGELLDRIDGLPQYQTFGTASLEDTQFENAWLGTAKLLLAKLTDVALVPALSKPGIPALWVARAAKRIGGVS